jgi:hypothetical protein
MNSQYSWTVYLLLLVLGIAILWSAGNIAGPETSVQQYTAFEVTHEDSDLVLTDEKTGEKRRGGDVSTTNVDNDIVCLPSYTRECAHTVKEYENQINSTATGSEFRYAYLDGKFYRLDSDRLVGVTYEQTDPSDVFTTLALDSDRLTEPERDVLEEGQTATTRPVPRTNQLITDDGQYYIILRTGSKIYQGGGSTCSSTGDGFCDRANRVRWFDWISGIGYGILGGLGVIVGSRGLLTEYRSK